MTFFLKIVVMVVMTTLNENAVAYSVAGMGTYVLTNENANWHDSGDTGNQNFCAVLSNSPACKFDYARR